MCRHLSICLSVLLLTVGLAWAQGAKPATGETPKPAAQAKDYVKALINEYDAGAERSGFFQVAGVDGEISKEEFDAAAGKEAGCLRKFDRWTNAAVHDLDRNGKLNWPEGEKYRQGIRKTVLDRFDKDKDGKLTGEEAKAANAYLAGGIRYSGPTGRATRTGRSGQAGQPGQPGQPGQTGQPRAGGRGRGGGGRGRSRAPDPAVVARWDTDKDGKVGEAESAAMRDHYRKLGTDRRQAWELKTFDADADGQLSDAEKGARDRQARGFGFRRPDEATTKQYDKDGDGKLSREERGRMYRDMRARQQKTYTEMWDGNGDGKVDDEERRAADGYRRQRFTEAMRRRELDRYDANKDGQLDEKETAKRDEDRRRMMERFRGRGRGRGRRRGGQPQGSGNANQQ